MKNIGLFFGSFDPITISHIAVCQKALNNYSLDEIWIVLAKQNPFKQNSTDFNIRYEMICNTLIDYFGYENNKICVSDIEQDVESFKTYDVLDYIKELNPDINFFIVTTTETLNEIDLWYNGDKILSENRFIVINDVGIDIHSTDIRNMVKNGNNPVPYVSKSVYEIINIHNLYEYTKKN